MRWVEVISLRCPANVNTQFVDEFLKKVGEFDIPKNLLEIRIYHHSVVETDLSIHIHWKSERMTQSMIKSPLGLRVSSVLKELGLLNHSVWIETESLEFPQLDENSKPRSIPPSDAKDNLAQAGHKLSNQKRL